MCEAWCCSFCKVATIPHHIESHTDATRPSCACSLESAVISLIESRIMNIMSVPGMDILPPHVAPVYIHRCSRSGGEHKYDSAHDATHVDQVMELHAVRGPD